LKLEDYLKKKMIAVPDFAKTIGVNKGTIYNYINGDRIPTLDIAMKIVKETKGVVSYEDLSA